MNKLLRTLAMLATCVTFAAASQAAEQAPYRLPALTFTNHQLVDAFRQAQIDREWFNETNLYLNSPQDFWHNCTDGWTYMAQEFGAMPLAEAQEHGIQTCTSIATSYFNCLHDKSLDYATSCLAYLFKEMEDGAE